MKTRRFTLFVLLMGMTLLTLFLLMNRTPTIAQGTVGVIERVSVGTGNIQGNAAALDRSDISLDGTKVCFVSYASNLVANDTNGVADVFVRDRTTGTTTRVSVANGGAQANGESYSCSISGNGQRMAFLSEASNLVSGDTNGFNDYFVRDLQTNTTIRVSVSSSGVQANNEQVSAANIYFGYREHFITISDDGQKVAFVSYASNLVANDTNGTIDVFVRNLATNITTRVSVASGGTQANDFSDYTPEISGDGSVVAFFNHSSNLVPNDTNGVTDVFVHVLATSVTERVSVASNGTQGNNSASQGLAISPDGRYVVFASWASNLVSSDTNATADIFIRDRQISTTERVSLTNTGGQSNGYCLFPVISADARFVTFPCYASNLVPNDTNDAEDVFVRDRLLNTTTRVSVSSGGAQANGSTDSNPAITGDGGLIVFASSVSNFIPNDTNNSTDVFVAQNENAPGPQTYSISGRVTDNANNPILNATISASGGHTTTTDGNGNYTLSGLMTGTYSFTASHSSYAFVPEVRTVSVPPSVTGHDFKGSSDPCGSSSLNAADTNYCTWPRFLGLPIDYDGTQSSFVLALQNWDYLKDVNAGRVNAWVDHKKPSSGGPSGSIWLYNRISSTGYYTAGKNIHCYENHCYSGHNGVDFSCRKVPNTYVCETDDQQVIRSAADGRVAKVQLVDNRKDYGKYVVVYHNNNYFTLYGHLKEISTWITEGTNVIKDQPIRIMGNSGRSTHTHLHFGVYVDNNGQGVWDGESIDRPVDPYGWKQEAVDPLQPSGGLLWVHDPEIQMSFLGEQGITFNDNTDLVEVSVSPDTFTGDVTLELSPGPVAGASATLRNAGVSFWLILREWLPGTTQLSSISAAQVNTQELSKPITLTIAYSDFGTRHLNTTQFGLYYWNESLQTWQILPGLIDEINQKIAAQTQQLGDFSLQAPLICPADHLELNDDFYTASPMPLSNSPINVLFDISIDEDWFWLDATSGFTYRLQTANLATGVDTIIEVYDTDGITILASDDNSGGGLASLLEWAAPQNGTYYVRIVQAPGSAYGCSAVYELTVSEEGTNTVYLPIILK